MYFFTRILLIFTCVIILKQPYKMREAPILYAKNLVDLFPT